jgi:DNA processing protein
MSSQSIVFAAPQPALAPTLDLLPIDPRYPADLRQLSAPPVPLYVRGDLGNQPAVAVVGTRAATRAMVIFTHALVEALVGSGYAVWSGGAVGVDAAAHRAALDFGGKTVAAFAGGLDRPYPPENGVLFDRILASGGALVSHVPPGTASKPSGFLARNAVLAAATRATVVVAAGERSGSLSTAGHARRLGRPLCIVPGSPWDDLGKGSAAELAKGGVIAVASPADLIAALGGNSAPSPRRPPGPRRSPLPSRFRPPLPLPEDPDERDTLAALPERGALHADEIGHRARLPHARVVAALVRLDLEGAVIEEPTGFFRRAGA